MTTSTQGKQIERPDWLPQEVWPSQIRSIAIDGSTIAYTDEGKGEVILLVHDGMWSFVWGQLIDQLRPHFRVIALDFPGSGLSPDDAREPSLEGDSRVLESFGDELRLKEVTLVLHDLGGAVGLGLAARRPDFVRGLVLVNTFAWPAHTSALRTMFRVMSSSPVKALNMSTNLIPKMTSGGFGVGRHLDPEARMAFLGGFKLSASRARFHALMKAARTETEYLTSIESSLSTTLASKPVLTVFGEKNDPFGFQEKFRGYFDEVDEMTIPGGNHFPMADEPVEVARRIVKWHAERVAD